VSRIKRYADVGRDLVVIERRDVVTRKTIGGTLLVATALVVLVASPGVSPAMAALKGEFAAFAECPLSTPELAGCFVSWIESGGITIGKQTVPIVNKQTIQGGFSEEESGALRFVGAAGGETLSKTPQKVPGGLSGLVRCNEIGSYQERVACEQVFENGVTDVRATTELAGPASSIGLNEENILFERGTGLSLPVRVKLENPFLGSACYIGSNAHPVAFNLTTGTTSPPPPNKPIKGKLGGFSSRGEGSILTIRGNSFVDNSFAAPGASGCGGGFSFLIDPIIDSRIGLPSPAGKNTAILNGTVEQTGAESAKAHSE
jgi:hypothetical protein